MFSRLAPSWDDLTEFAVRAVPVVWGLGFLAAIPVALLKLAY